MSTSHSPCHEGCWQNMAVVEVDDEGENLCEILDDISFDSWLDPQSARPGKVRYALMVNAARGADRAAMATYALLSALQSIADSGALAGFTVVSGEHWVRRGEVRHASVQPCLESLSL